MLTPIGIQELGSLGNCFFNYFGKIIIGMLFFTADSLADLNNYERRDFGVASLEPALGLCLDIISSFTTGNEVK